MDKERWGDAQKLVYRWDKRLRTGLLGGERAEPGIFRDWVVAKMKDYK